LEGLEERLAPATDYWVAPAVPPGQTAASWDIDTDWSLGHKPTANTDDVVLDGGAGHSSTPINIPNGSVEAPKSVTFKDWTGSLTVDGNLTTTTLELDPRAAGTNDLIIDTGGTVIATSSFRWQGDGITGPGTFQVKGTATINGTDANHKPSLAALLQVGDGTVGTTMTFADRSQPLVVTGNGNVTVKNNGTLTFNEGQQLQGVPTRPCRTGTA
jgi:hypothetical protein